MIYAVSGIAVNHAADWNPNYRVVTKTIRISPLEPGKILSADQLRAILSQIGETEPVKNVFYPDPEHVRIFTANHTIEVHLSTGEVLQEQVTPRPLLYPMNFLHLNHPKAWWTWMADLYAATLAILAITGLFVLKGKKGITGRGAWLTTIGILVPLVFLWLYL
jgi:hypothetical protein